MAGADILPGRDGFDRRVAVVLAAIAAASLVPLGGEAGAGGLDEVVHLAMFGALGWVARRAGSGVRATLGAIVLAAGYGGLMEGLQGSFGRDPSWSDWVADVIGGAAGAIAAGLRGPDAEESR